ncbi:hypothetical protein Salat_2592900 [Sesamum alatum]|uniref:Uncharacterized protein n=1 Tax=Sesamum alatum TaxID=300844 RepID=A0AAE2CAA3_9LAMI|nr:hypothetical protein Salat_2592900 [Sesamum alatum]
MSRFLSQSLPRASLRPPTALISHHRHRSNKTHQAQLIEVDLDAASSSQPDSPEASAEVITLGIKKLEEAIHSIIVRRAAPDWLPFLPGYSYWVPPRATSMRNHPAGSMIEVIGKLTASGTTRNRRLQNELLSEDEQMSLTSAKGWPSSGFFIEGTSPIHPIPVVEMEVKIQDNADDASNSEDEEEAGKCSIQCRKETGYGDATKRGGTVFDQGVVILPVIGEVGWLRECFAMRNENGFDADIVIGTGLLDIYRAGAIAPMAQSFSQGIQRAAAPPQRTRPHVQVPQGHKEMKNMDNC